MLRIRCIPLAIAVLALLLPFSAQAQQPQNDNQSQNPLPQRNGMRGRGAWGRRGAQRRGGMARLAQKLNLTDQQKQQFRQIARDLRQQAMAVRNDGSLSDTDKKAKLKEIRKQAHLQMFSVLTPEQKDQLKQMREERLKQMQKNQGSGDTASIHKPASAQDDDPFAGMTSDDDEPEGGS